MLDPAPVFPGVVLDFRLAAIRCLLICWDPPVTTDRWIGIYRASRRTEESPRWWGHQDR
ncbi:hypothetical protein GCM10027290_62960 [Micromonospora sonneratiae]